MTLFHRMFCDVGGMVSMRAARRRKIPLRCARASNISSRCVAGDARKRSRKQSHCFFHFAGVNEM
jgi:hypothetical protein